MENTPEEPSQDHTLTTVRVTPSPTTSPRVLWATAVPLHWKTTNFWRRLATSTGNACQSAWSMLAVSWRTESLKPPARWATNPPLNIPGPSCFKKRAKRLLWSSAFPPSSVARDSSEVARDPRGFAVKFYTEDGNWDLVGNNLPVFFIRDAIKFPDVIHALKPDPVTFARKPIASSTSWPTPEAQHMLTFLFVRAASPKVTGTRKASVSTPTNG